MKNEILERAMFAMPLSKDARNSGIMAGFEEDMPEDTEDQGMEEMPPMARTPQNPEILMNTLRGDMRSMDARYQELAQMVGEDAAMETPPEVLAMLQPQLAAPQAGIGGLPQAQGMMPPGAGMPPPGMGMPPDQMGAPQPAPAMPQGGIPMPAGMESAPPFSPGAEAPQGYAYGGIVRGAQMVGDKLGQYGSAANAALGRMFMNPQGISQPILENVRGPGGRYTAQQIVTGGEALTAPTFTQGLMQGTARLADQYPRLAAMTAPALGALGLANAPSGGSGGPGTDMASQIPRDTIEDRVANSVLNKPPILSMSFDKPFTTTRPDLVTITEGPRPSAPKISLDGMATTDADQAAVDERQVDAAKVDTDPLGSFINQKLKAFDEREAKGKPLSKIDRIKASQAEYGPLFEELLGSDKESAKINALLLLSEAGLKLASTAKPTFAMAVSDAFANVPRGFAAIAAQEREMGIKTKTAALQQAITDVDAQDRYAQQLQLQVLKGDQEIIKKMAAANKGNVTEDVGIGGRATKDSNGNFLKFSIDGNSDAVKSAINSRYTLRQTDNPYVSNMGEAPTLIVEDKAGRLELGSTLAAHNNSLKSIEIAKNSLSQLYSPGTFFVDKVNNLIVPIDFTGAVKPDLSQEAAKSTLMTLQNTLSKSIASANNSGRTAVQEQEWARQLTAAIANPVAFFKDRELAAKTLTAIETSIRNARQETLTQLGFEGNDYVMRTPNTGTKNDPFPISADPAEQKMMYTFLGSTVGKLQDSKALVHLRMPNGQIQQFTPTQLRALNQ
jgi:hypothetical protein